MSFRIPAMYRRLKIIETTELIEGNQLDMDWKEKKHFQEMKGAQNKVQVNRLKVAENNKYVETLQNGGSYP